MIDIIANLIGFSLTVYLLITAFRSLVMGRDRSKDFVNAVIIALAVFYLIRLIIREFLPYFFD